jgi:hypothetical protein
MQRPEYPRNVTKLYGWLEDGLFRLYTAIKKRDLTGVRERAGDIIVTASEIAEYAENKALTEAPKEG